MFIKLVLKLLFKACLPLVAVAGILSYGLYLKGGDPMKMWSSVASRITGSIGQSTANTAQSFQNLSPIGEGSQNSTTVYSWVDANGTTHFGSQPPPGIQAKTLNINSSRNVVAPTYAPARTPNRSISASASTPRTVQTTSTDSGSDENLPGMAGMKLPIDIKPEDLGLSQEELLNLLQKR